MIKFNKRKKIEKNYFTLVSGIAVSRSLSSEPIDWDKFLCTDVCFNRWSIKLHNLYRISGKLPRYSLYIKD